MAGKLCLGSNEFNKLSLGDIDIKSIFKGNVLYWSKEDKPSDLVLEYQGIFNNTTAGISQRTTIDIGTPNNKRKVIVFYNTLYATNPSIAESMAINGIEANIIYNQIHSISGNSVLTIGYAEIPNNTTTQVEINYTTATVRSSIAVYTLTGDIDLSKSTTNKEEVTSNEVTTNIDAKEGFIIAHSNVRSSNITRPTYNNIDVDGTGGTTNISLITGHKEIEQGIFETTLSNPSGSYRTALLLMNIPTKLPPPIQWITNITKSNNDNWTNKSVTVSITSNLELKPTSSWNLSADKKRLQKIYPSNNTQSVTVETVEGDTRILQVEVIKIDKVLPIMKMEDNRIEELANGITINPNIHSNIEFVASDNNLLLTIKGENVTTGTTVTDLDNLDSTSRRGNISHLPDGEYKYYCIDHAGNKSNEFYITFDRTLAGEDSINIGDNLSNKTIELNFPTNLCEELFTKFNGQEIAIVESDKYLLRCDSMAEEEMAIISIASKTPSIGVIDDFYFYWYSLETNINVYTMPSDFGVVTAKNSNANIILKYINVKE